MKKNKNKKPMIYVVIAAAVLMLFAGGVILSRAFLQTSASTEKGKDKDGSLAEAPASASMESDVQTSNGGEDASDNPKITSDVLKTENSSTEHNSEEPDGSVGDRNYSSIKAPVIMLDPGHGGIDNGCAVGEIFEKDVNFDIALKTKALLEDMGYQVVMTREEDVKVFLEERVQACLDAKADIFVSIHQNLYDGEEAEYVYGMESYYSSYHSPEGSKKLAQMVQSKLIANTEARDRGVLEVDDLVVIVKATCPSVLIETGFLSCTKEREKLLSDEYQNKIASAIADAIDEFFK